MIDGSSVRPLFLAGALLLVSCGRETPPGPCTPCADELTRAANDSLEDIISPPGGFAPAPRAR